MNNQAMPPFPCDDWAERLAMSSPDDARALEGHIASCEACAAVKREYDEIDRLITSIKCINTLPGVPAQLLRLWEEENRQVTLHRSAGNGASMTARGRSMGEISFAAIIPFAPRAEVATHSLATLEKCCQQEMDNYRRGEESDDRYCLEIFYRALKKQDDQASEVLVRCLRGTMIGWLRSYSRYDSAMRYESEDNYVIEAFARMWNAWHDQSTNFETLAAALSYLKLCLLRAVQDTLRFYEKQMLELPEPGTGSPDEPVAREEDDGRELWEVIESFLPTERERRAAYLLFHCNLKAREVMRYCPGEFEHVREVHRLRRNIFDRLMRNADQLRWRLRG